MQVRRRCIDRTRDDAPLKLYSRLRKSRLCISLVVNSYLHRHDDHYPCPPSDSRVFPHKLAWEKRYFVRLSQTRGGWGAKVIDRIAADQGVALPEMKGLISNTCAFSSRKLRTAELVSSLLTNCPGFTSSLASGQRLVQDRSVAHSPTFLALMDRYMPNWRDTRELLNRLPARHEQWN
jgi:hypothetical protein